MSTQKENLIRERRTVLAISRNMMGANGKLGVILTAFGTPIIRQGTALHEATYLESPEDDTDWLYETTASGQKGPLVSKNYTHDNEGQISEEGMLFDGLRIGIHLDIMFKEDVNELKVHYKGYLVYRELAGELQAYNPFPEWETIIDHLYKKAKPVAKEKLAEKEFKISQIIDAKKKSFWERMKMLWGV